SSNRTRLAETSFDRMRPDQTESDRPRLAKIGSNCTRSAQTA
ncbi:hypothetical protein CP02DC21_1806, partial [Chlamydia psittaci 02DC21]